MADFTPGPWRYQREKSVTDSGRGGLVLYEVYTATGLYGHPATCEREEDARLIAAAPDLLAVVVAVEWSGGGDGRDDGPSCPSCGGLKYNGPPEDHAPDCALHAALVAAGRRG